MIKSLDMISPSMPDEKKWQAVKDNFVTVAKGMQKLGVELLYDTTSAVQVSFGTSETRYPGFSVQSHTSGGLVRVDFQSTALVGSNGIYVSLKVDGEVKAKTFIQAPASTIYGHCALVWNGQLNEGSHVFEIYAKSDSGTAYLGNTSSLATMQVVEFLNF